MKPQAVQFRLKMDDPFQVRLDEAVKTLRHGTRNLFLVNLCRALFGGMDIEQIKEAMNAVGYSQQDALEELLSKALSRFEVGRSLQGLRDSEPVRRPTPAAPIRSSTSPASLRSLSIDN